MGQVQTKETVNTLDLLKFSVSFYQGKSLGEVQTKNTWSYKIKIFFFMILFSWLKVAMKLIRSLSNLFIKLSMCTKTIFYVWFIYFLRMYFCTWLKFIPETLQIEKKLWNWERKAASKKMFCPAKKGFWMNDCNSILFTNQLCVQ